MTVAKRFGKYCNIRLNTEFQMSTPKSQPPPNSYLVKYQQCTALMRPLANVFEKSRIRIIIASRLHNYRRQPVTVLFDNFPEPVPVIASECNRCTLKLSGNTLRIKPRRKFRNSYCSYAPFWLNIRKADIVNEKLQEVKKIKVVTQCRGGKDYSDYVLKEYLAYKIYNLLSPVSFRVRLVHMKYIDTGRKNKLTESWGFLIEPEEMVAERNEAIVVKKDEISMRYMRPQEMDVAAMFQYMIGNPDYSIAGRHNMKILGLPGFGDEGYTPVPYDFDFTGIVNAEYAIPGDNLGITSVTQRYYLGPCREDHEFQAAIDHINSNRDEILELVSEFPYLNDKHKKEMIGYLDNYFNSASGPNFIGTKIRTTCR